MDDIKSSVENMHAIMLFMHNIPRDKILEQVYGRKSEAYMKEKSQLLGRSLTAFWGQLDTKHKFKLVEAAIKAYSTESRKMSNRD